MMQPGKRLSAMLGLATGMILAMGVWSPYVTAPLPVGNGTDVNTGSPAAPLAPPLRIANIGNLTLQGVIVGNTKNPGMAMLGEPGAPPVMVPEGAKVGSDILLERVLPDRVILRRPLPHHPPQVRPTPQIGDEPKKSRPEGRPSNCGWRHR